MFWWIKGFFGFACTNFKYTLLIFLTPILSYFIAFYLEKLITKEKQYMHDSKTSAWKTEFTDNSIKTISLTFENEYNPIISFSLDGWKQVRKVYKNNLKLDFEHLYMGSDFFYKKNNRYYSIVDNRRCDSIVYKFPPADIIEVYDKNRKLIKIENNCFQSKELYNIYNLFFIK